MGGLGPYLQQLSPVESEQRSRALIAFKSQSSFGRGQSRATVAHEVFPCSQRTGSGQHSFGLRTVSKCALAALQLSPRLVVAHMSLNRMVRIALLPRTLARALLCNRAGPAMNP